MILVNINLLDFDNKSSNNCSKVTQGQSLLTLDPTKCNPLHSSAAHLLIFRLCRLSLCWPPQLTPVEYYSSFIRSWPNIRWKRFTFATFYFLKLCKNSATFGGWTPKFMLYWVWYWGGPPPPPDWPTPWPPLVLAAPLTSWTRSKVSEPRKGWHQLWITG